jgi:hypothetical protein
MGMMGKKKKAPENDAPDASEFASGGLVPVPSSYYIGPGSWGSVGTFTLRLSGAPTTGKPVDIPTDIPTETGATEPVVAYRQWTVRRRYPEGFMLAGGSVLSAQSFAAPEPPITVVGAVSLWGRVIEHTDGYRAQYAYPNRLAVVGGTKQLAVDLGLAYGVECDLW